MSNPGSFDASNLPDGAYSVWHGKAYRSSSFASGGSAIRPINPEDVDDSFEPDPFGHPYRHVNRSELTEKFELTTYCRYRGYRFCVNKIKDDGTLALELVATNYEVARELGLTEYDRGYFITVNRDEVEDLVQERVDTL